MPKATVLTGFGINCDAELLDGFQKVGFEANAVHINEAINDPSLLDADVLGLAGGFSFGQGLEHIRPVVNGHGAQCTAASVPAVVENFSKINSAAVNDADRLAGDRVADLYSFALARCPGTVQITLNIHQTFHYSPETIICGEQYDTTGSGSLNLTPFGACMVFARRTAR